MEHSLSIHFDALRSFRSSTELERSELYQRLRPEIERVLDGVVSGRFAGAPRAGGDAVHVGSWNIQRGTQFDGILETLRSHPRLAASDVLLLTELDHGMARSGNRQVTHDLARELGYDYVFAPCYLSLVNGSGLEFHVEGENREALHGNALLSRWPIRDGHALALPNGIDKMAGREKRLGRQRAVVGVVEHPAGPLRCVSLHLDAHSTQRHRHQQMQRVLDHLDGFHPELPAIIGGDWNTSTYDSSRAMGAILGYWVRVFMGPRNVVRNHLPHPDRLFERELFQGLERRGWRYREFNLDGGCTVHYDVEDAWAYNDLREWVPNWCFWFVRQALRPLGGRCSLKLDWFTATGLEPTSEGPPAVLAEVNRGPAGPLSDHDPIVVAVRHERSARSRQSPQQGRFE